MRVLLAGLLLVTACTGPPAPPPSVSLSVSLDQSRDLENRHLLAARVVNTGGVPVEVVRLQLRSPAFAGVAPTVRDAVLATGRAAAFPLPYGAADCRGSGPATIRLGHRVDGVLREVEVPVPAKDPLLARLHTRECRLAELGRAAALSFAPGWTRTGDVATGELVLTGRRGAHRVAVSAVDGSVIFTLRPLGPLPLVLAGPVRLPVEARPSRCDPHALAESKRTYDFTLAVALDGGEPLAVTVRPEPADVVLLEQLLRDVCL